MYTNRQIRSLDFKYAKNFIYRKIFEARSLIIKTIIKNKMFRCTPFDIWMIDVFINRI